MTPDRQACERVFRLASPARIAELDLDLQKFYTWARVAHAIETMMFAHVNTGKAKEMTIFCSEGISRHYGGIEWTLCRRRHNVHYADLRIMPMSGRRHLSAAVSAFARSA